MLTVRAPAKINWSLFVLNKRDDGYHNICSLLQCVGLYDTLSFEHSEFLTLESDFPLPSEQNLVFKAALLLKDYSGIAGGARIRLKKEIPSGAGLGGGSSDAAYTLMALNELWELHLGKEILSALGSQLGSDVPFFFDGPLALAEGRGELLTSLPGPAAYTLLLVKADCSVSTAWAYGALDEEQSVHGKRGLIKTDDSKNKIRSVQSALAEGDLYRLAEKAQNDFERVVIRQYPVIGAVKEQLLRCGARMALMSGSGAAVFGLFDDESRAARAAEYFSSCFCKVVKTLVKIPG